MSEDSGAGGEDYSTLIRTINDRLEDIEDATYNQPALFIQNLLERSSDQYRAFFRIMRDICEDSESLADIDFGGDEDDEGGRYHVFNILQGIERDYARIAELPFQHELYYFVRDVIQDLNISSDVVVIPGDSSEVFVERSSERYGAAIKTKLEYYSDIDENHRIIEYQRTELKNPESYPLLIHELFHVFIDDYEDDLDQISQILGEIRDQIDPGQSEYAEEILVDLLSVNYVGPIYAHTISKMPEKIGSHTDLVHPDNNQREGYLLKYLDYIEERNANLPIADVDVISQARDTIGEQNTDDLLTDFENIQTKVEELFEDINASAYQDVYGDIKIELGMPDASNKQTRKKIYELFLYSESDTEPDSAVLEMEESGDEDGLSSNSQPKKPNVAVAIRAVFLLNLLLEDDREPSRLYETYVVAFKKWYVRKQTSEVRDQAIDQTPERERHKNEDLGRY